MATLSVSHLTVHFRGAERPAVEDVSFTLEAGQIAMVIGPNGSGKTTLLRSILGFIPASGQVTVCDLPVKEAYHYIGYVPQHVRFDTTLPLTGRELLGMPLYRWPRQRRRSALAWAIETFHLSAFLNQPLGTLSGGQLKRLLLARAMMQGPRLLLLDEPEAGIDVGGEQTLYQLLAHLVTERQLTALISSHELNIVVEVAHQVICLNRRLYGIGPPLHILTPEILLQLYGSTAALYWHNHSHEEPS